MPNYEKALSPERRFSQLKIPKAVQDFVLIGLENASCGGQLQARKADAAEFGKLDPAVANFNEAIRALDYYIQRMSEIVEEPEEKEDVKS
jgi:hypothetical protein